jgi:hypothetical protein
MILQIAKPEVPQLIVEMAPGGIAVLIQRFQVAEDLGNPLSPDAQTVIARLHSQ